MAIPINMEYFDEYLRQGDPLKKERAEANIISTPRSRRYEYQRVWSYIQ